MNKNRKIQVAVVCLFLFTGLLHAQPKGKPAQAVRSALDLSGNWEFKVDALDVGRSNQWFKGDVPFERTVRVPGAWNAQGIQFESEDALRDYEDKRIQENKNLNGLGIMGGSRESARVYSVYPGPGWYRKTVTIPANWKGRVPWLIFHGVHREAEVWVNGRSAGVHRSYLTPFQIELSSFAQAGESISIVARVDARRRKDVDPLMGCLDTLDFLYITWGGIHRPVTLEATETTRIDEVFVLPAIATETAEIRVQIAGEKIPSLALQAEILDDKNKTVGSARQLVTGQGNETVISMSIPRARLWSPQTPHLYTARLRLLSADTVVDSRAIRFGMREFKVEGRGFLLNGKPVFLRGYGDDCIFPNTISPPTLKEDFRRRLSIAREYGFNYVRHHSWTPPAEYLEAADELGMMVQPEFPFAYRWDLPANTETKRAALEQWEASIRMNRNHPSIVTWCMGNELYGSFDIAGEMYQIARRLDPSRPILDTDGCNFDEQNRSTLDFLVVPFNEGESIGYQDGKYNVPASIHKPVVGHEMGYFVTLPDLAQINLFKNGLRPYWLFQTRDLVQQKNLGATYIDWLIASYRLQAVSLKSNMEAARRSGLSGTSVWLFQDYPNCAEGIVDMFFRPKGVQAEEFRKYNSPTVLLLDTPRRNWWQNETAKVSFVVSRFEDSPSENATLRWTVQRKNKTVAQGRETNLSVRSGEVHKLVSTTFNIPAGSRGDSLTLTAELTDAQGKTGNSWTLWSFPKDHVQSSGSNVCVIKFSALRSEFPWITEHSGGSIESGTKLVITTTLNREVLAFLNSGGRVLLLEPEPLFAVERTNFRLSSWDGGGPSGTLFDSTHPVFRNMGTQGWCDLQFYSLIQGSKTVMLDTLPIPIEPLVRCIDRPTRLANRAYLFEASAGEGGLLVSSFNFKRALESKDPAGIFLLDRMIRYAASSEFMPKMTLPMESFASKVAN